jgi:hypothetical protein
MDGGIKRHFRLEHCRRFSADLDAVKAFFLEGLPEKVVDSCTRRLSELLKQLFEKDTAYLVKLYASAPDNGDATVATKCGACFAFVCLRCAAPPAHSIASSLSGTIYSGSSGTELKRMPLPRWARATCSCCAQFLTHSVSLQKFIDKFKADIELRNFIKHLKPH